MSLEKKENAMTQEKAIAITIAKDFFQQIDTKNITSGKSDNPFDPDLTRYVCMQGRAYKYSIEEYVGAMKYLLAEEGVNIETTQTIPFKNRAGETRTTFSLSEDQIYLAKVKCALSAEDGRFVARKNTKMPEFLRPCQNNLAEILLKASRVGNSPVADSVLGQGIPKETRNQALFIAIGRNHPDVVRVLLNYNADVNQQEKTLGGHTPLIHAIMLGRHECVKTLLKKGADLQQTLVTRQSEKTALQIAIRNKNKEVIKAIFDYHNDTKKLGVLNDLLDPLSKEEQALFLPYLGYQHELQRKEILENPRFAGLFGSEDGDLFPKPPTSAQTSRRDSDKRSSGSNHKEDDRAESSFNSSSASASPAADLPPPPPLVNLDPSLIRQRAQIVATRAAAINQSLLGKAGVDAARALEVTELTDAIFSNVAEAQTQIFRLVKLKQTGNLKESDIQTITALLKTTEERTSTAEIMAKNVIAHFSEQQAALANMLEMLQLFIDKARHDFDAAKQYVLRVCAEAKDADPNLIKQAKDDIEGAEFALARASTDFAALKDAKERAEPIENLNQPADGILAVLDELNSLTTKAGDIAKAITNAREEQVIRAAAIKAEEEAAAQAEAIARAAAKEKEDLFDSLMDIVSAIEKEIPKAQAAVAMASTAAVKTVRITLKLSDQTIQAAEAVYAATEAARAILEKAQGMAYPPTSEALRKIIIQATDTYLSLQQAVVNAYRAATHAHTKMTRSVVKAASEAVSAATAKQPKAVDEEKSAEEVNANGVSTFVDRCKAALADFNKKNPTDAEAEVAKIEANLIATQNKVQEAKRVLKTATAEKTTAEAEKGAADEKVREAKALLEKATAEKVRIIEAEKAAPEKPVEEAAAVQASATGLAKKLWTRVKAGKSPAEIAAIQEATETLTTATKAAANASKKLTTATKAAEKATIDLAATEEAAKALSEDATIARKAANAPWLESEASVDDHSAQAAKALKAAKKAAKTARVASPDPVKAAEAASKAARAAKKSAVQAYRAVGAPLPPELKKIKRTLVELDSGVNMKADGANEAEAKVEAIADPNFELKRLTIWQEHLLGRSYANLLGALKATSAIGGLIPPQTEAEKAKPGIRGRLLLQAEAEVEKKEVLFKLAYKIHLAEAKVKAQLAALAVKPDENLAPHQQEVAAEGLVVGAAVESVAQSSPSSSSTPTSGVAASLSNLFSSISIRNPNNKKPSAEVLHRT